MKITVVAFQDCMTSAVFGLMDAFAIAAVVAERTGQPRWRTHDIRLATAAGSAVRGFGGFRIEAQASLWEAADSDVVLVPPILGDVDATLAREGEMVAWLSQFRGGPTLMASTCTGAFLLAEAGVLDGKRITTNPAFGDRFRVRYPAVRLALDERIVEDSTVICAGSTTAFLDLAVFVVDRLGGHDLAVSTAKALSMDKNPASQRPYLLFVAPRDHGDKLVLQLQEWIEVNHRQPVAVADMARAGGMSLRNLGRRFQAATGQTPMQYLRAVRLETAKRLLEVEETSLERVAQQVGYADARAFIRAFGGVVGLAPGQYRRRFRARWASGRG